MRTNLLKTNHEKVIFAKEGQAKMILAYHTSGNGISFGGIRLLPSNTADAFEKGLKDALRLSESMTNKLALINEYYGGCKSVAFLPEKGKTKEFLHDIGIVIEKEEGKFISAIDFGFESNDAKIIREKTKYIFAIKDSQFGQSGVTTAYGIFEGIKTSLNFLYGSSVIKGKSFAVQGLGSVGMELSKKLADAGGKVYVSDLDKQKIKEIGKKCEAVFPEKILFLNIDVLCPCGPAYVINKNTIPKLKCKIIAGGANCPLEDEIKDDLLLKRKGILMAPDYAINSGGVIQGIEELKKGSLENAISRLKIVPENLKKIYKYSFKKRMGTYAAARELISDRKRDKRVL